MEERSFKCSHCGNKLKIDESYIGRRARCPYCEKKFDILNDTNEEREGEQALSAHVDSRILKIVCCSLVVVVVALVGVVGYFVVSENCTARQSEIKSQAIVAPIVAEKKKGLPVAPQKEFATRTNGDEKDVLKSCVTISCISGVGSGFFVRHNNETKVITCKHVIDDEPVVVVKDINGKEYTVKSIAVATDRDIAVVDVIDGDEIKNCFELAVDVGAVKLMSELVCYGDSEGTGVIVPCFGKLLGIGPVSVETDTPFVPGNSGGPVVLRKDYEVVGVASVLTHLNENNKWVKGTRFEKQTRHFAVRLDNLHWGELQTTENGIVKSDDVETICEIAKKSLKAGNLDKAISLYTYAGRKGSSVALNQLGEILLTSGKKEDAEAAFRLFEKATKEASPAGMANLGACYLWGIGVLKDSSKACGLFRRASNGGDDYGSYLLGVCYRDGIGIEKCVENALRCFENAAKRGEKHAQYALGECYQEGMGVVKDENKAYGYFKDSARQSYATAEWKLGVCYDEGIGVQTNIAIAAQWYLKAAEHGNAKAQCRLGRMYLVGEGVPHDAVKAFRWYEKSAIQGNADAQAGLGVCYRDGDGVAIDLQKSIEWFARSAKRGCGRAQYELGVLYEEGRGVKRNYADAKYWYEQAYNNGWKWVANEIGRMYAEGKGVAVDHYTAVWWYEQSNVEDEIIDAIRSAAHYFYERKQYDDAIAMYKKRADIVEFQNRIGVCYSQMDQFGAAVKWFKKATGSSCRCVDRGWAWFNLGKSYLQGNGIEMNCWKAKDCFRKAERDGVEVDSSWFEECNKSADGWSRF